MALVLCAVATAHADPGGQVALTTTAPASANSDTNFEAVMSYSLQGGTYGVVTISLPWQPNDVLFISATAADTFTLDTSNPGLYVWRAQNLTVPATGISGDIRVTLKTKRWQCPDGTPINFGAILDATWTPIAGGVTQAVTSSSSATTISHAAANLTFGNHGVSSIGTGTRWINHPTLGPGLQIRFDFRIYNTGSASIQEGGRFHLELGSKLYFIRAFARADNVGDPPVPAQDNPHIDLAPVAFSPTAGGVVEAYTTKAITSTNIFDSLLASGHLHVDVFIPCSEPSPSTKKLPLTNVDLTDAAYRIKASFLGREQVFGNTTVDRPVGPITDGTSAITTAGACGTGGSLTKSPDGGTIGVDTTITWTVNVQPPRGIIAVDNAMVVDVLPPDVTNVTASITPELLAQFDLWYCDIPEAAGYFTADEFRTLYLGNCHPSWSPGDTHVVLFAEGGWGDGVDIPNAAFNISTYIPVDYLQNHGTRIWNRAYFNGQADLDGNGTLETLGDDVAELSNEDPFEDVGFRDSAVGSYPRAEDYGIPASTPHTVGMGSYGKVWLRFYRNTNFEQPRNPKIDVVVPPGIILAKADGSSPIDESFAGGGCAGVPAFKLSPQAADRPLHWDLGDAAHPYLLWYYCFATQISFRLDPTYPWVNGQTFTFKATITAENAGPPLAGNPNTADAVFTASVPGEMRVDVTPGCTAGGGPAFDVVSRNTGGVDLTGMETVFTVPRAGVDGTTENASFVRVEVGAGAPAAAIYEAFDGTWHALTPGQDAGLAGATKVRMRNFGIVARGADAHFRVVLARTSAGGAPAMFGRADVDAVELPIANSGASDAWIQGQCPGVLHITKFFDRDRDGVKDQGEELLRGWRFNVSNGIKTWTVTTDDAGEGRLDLLPASYTVTEVVPSGGVTWVPPVGGGFARVAAVPSNGVVDVTFGNVCDCPATGTNCRVGTCSPEGTCTIVDSAPGIACDDADACTTDACLGGVCVGTSITPSGFCDTDDSDQCATGHYACQDGAVDCVETTVDLVEACNGLDDDCDGDTDEDFGAGTPCQVGIGACRTDGVIACIGEVPQCNAVAGLPHDETCNAKDDDCDGQTDEGFGVGDACTLGRGECLRAGHLVCDGGRADCDAEVVSPTAETCNAKDDDCDGLTDEAEACPFPLPDTAIDSGPEAATTDDTATFTFSFSGVPAIQGYWCALDGANPTPCTTTRTFTGLSDGPHTLDVYVISDHGVKDPSPAHYAWTVDHTHPETQILTSPAATTSDTSATFAYTDPNHPSTSTFQCRLDGGSWAACNGGHTSYQGLTPGEHTFEVATQDAGGEVDPTPASFTWIIRGDTAPPETEITEGPAAVVSFGDDATFVYDDPADASVTTFDCRVDGGAWKACDGGTTTVGAVDLSNGDHTFEARACKRGAPPTADVCDSTPAHWDWKIVGTACPSDDTPPVIACTPSVTAECGDAVDPHAFIATATDACAPVGVGWSAPDAYPVGAHSVSFHATDGNGNLAECTTEVVIHDTHAPSITCPDDVTLDAPDTCRLAVTSATATDTCAASADVTLTSDAPASLGLGATTIIWTATDPSGNHASCTQTVTLVDVTAPVLTCPEAATIDLPADTCSYSGTLHATLRDNCEAAPGIDAPLGGTWPVGTHTVAITGSDAAGHQAACDATLNVRDVVAPTVSCGILPTGPAAPPAPVDAASLLPVVVTVTGSDACAVTAEARDLTCVDDLGVAQTGAACPVSATGATVTATALPAAGSLTVAWTAAAIDASGHETTAPCTLTLVGPARPGDPDTHVTHASSGCAGGATDGLDLVVLGLALLGLGRRRRA